MSFKMDFNVETRKKQLESLDQFICASRESVNVILNCLGWTPEKVLNNSSMRICSINSSHKVPSQHIDKHIQKCSLKSEGYDLDGEFLSEPINDPKCSILIDDLKKMELIAEMRKKYPNFKTGWNGQDAVPKTVDRNISTYSVGERACFYDYTIKHTAGPPKPDEFTVYAIRRIYNEMNERYMSADMNMLHLEKKGRKLTFLESFEIKTAQHEGKNRMNAHLDVVYTSILDTYKETKDGDKPLSYEEELAQIRDAKRRRIKYRSVHTNRKSYIEVIREVIDGQMEIYKDWVSERKTSTNINKNDNKQISANLEDYKEKKLFEKDNVAENSTKSDSSLSMYSSKSRDKWKRDDSHRSQRENIKHSRFHKDDAKNYKERKRHRERSRERHSSRYSSRRNHRRDSRDGSRDRSRYKKRRS